MTDDPALLRRYVASRDEAAFAELVRRHVDGVYSMACRRLGGDAQMAADVTQQVFVVLARHAGRLTDHPALAGWLYTTTRNTAANAVRAERRRRHREQEAHAMHESDSNSEPPTDWKSIAPLLEAAMDSLRADDRLAILLRFIERQSFAEIGAALRVSEDTARKRVERSVEKLRLVLSRRAITSTASALALALSGHAVTAAPAGLSATVSGAALTAAASGGSALTFLALMSMTKVQFSLAGALLLLATLGVLWQQQLHASLRDELVSARQQVRETAQLRSENARLAAPGAISPGNRRDDLAPLRAEAGELRRQIAAAAPTLATGLVPASQWRNVGQASPGAALETLLWAAENDDIATVGRMASLDTRTRLEADTLFSEMPPELIKAGNITSAEEMIGLGWTLGAQLAGARMASLAHAPFAGPASQDPDDVTLHVQLQKRDGTIREEEMRFHRGPDGWQWVLSHRNLDFVGSGLGDYSRHILDQK